MTKEVEEEEKRKMNLVISKRNTPKICILCVCVIINKHSFKPFMCFHRSGQYFGVECSVNRTGSPQDGEEDRGGEGREEEEEVSGQYLGGLNVPSTAQGHLRTKRKTKEEEEEEKRKLVVSILGV